MPSVINADIIESQLADLDNQAEVLADRLAHINAQREVLRGLLSRAISGTKAPSSARERLRRIKEQGRKSAPRKRGSFSSAVVREIEAQPGIHRDDLLDELLPVHGSTTSDNPRKSALTQLGNLARKGTIINKNKRLYLPDEEQGNAH